MFQQGALPGAELSRISRLAIAYAPPRGRVIKPRLFRQISFFITDLLAGLLADKIAACLANYRQTDTQFN